MELQIKSTMNMMHGGGIVMGIQLTFFDEEKTEMDYLREDMNEVKESNDKVRKSMFARHAELSRKYMELHERMQIIERNICKGDYGKT